MKAMSNLFEAMLIHAAPPQSGYMSSLCEHLDEAPINSLSLTAVEYTQQPVLSVAGIHHATLGLSATEDLIPT